MELTPQRLREVEFKERWRGYDPEEVDDLLERVAAGLEDFENRVRQATERAVRAEQRASEGSDTDETLRRTLVLAQRTADAAIADADQRAQHPVGADEESPAAIDLAGAERGPDREGDATQAHDVLADESSDEDAGATTGPAAKAFTADPASATGGEHDLVLSGPGRDIDTDDDGFF